MIGLHLPVGAGGVLAEALADSRALPKPVDREMVLEAFRSLRLAPERGAGA